MILKLKTTFISYYIKNSLKIPKTLSESVNQRSDNTMAAKRHRTNNDLQNTTQNTKDRATQTQLESEGELGCSGKVSSSGYTSGTRRANLVTNLLISYE